MRLNHCTSYCHCPSSCSHHTLKTHTWQQSSLDVCSRHFVAWLLPARDSIITSILVTAKRFSPHELLCRNRKRDTGAGKCGYRPSNSEAHVTVVICPISRNADQFTGYNPLLLTVQHLFCMHLDHGMGGQPYAREHIKRTLVQPMDFLIVKPLFFLEQESRLWAIRDLYELTLTPKATRINDLTSITR